MKNCLVIYLEGEPATGKSTIFKHIRRQLFGNATEFRSGLLRGIKQGQFYMLGVFDGSTFEGTDRLSMAVINDAIPFIKGLQDAPERSVVFVEGARLANAHFMTETGARLFLLHCIPEVLTMRHAERGDEQTERFLKSRHTAVCNLSKKYPAQWVDNSAGRSPQIADALVKMANQFANG